MRCPDGCGLDVPAISAYASTYSESAEGVMITRERAIIELQRHGLATRADIEAFDAEFGPVTKYNAGDVLRWLGY